MSDSKSAPVAATVSTDAFPTEGERLTAAQRLLRHDAGKRGAATKQGSPIPRAAWSIICPNPMTKNEDGDPTKNVLTIAYLNKNKKLCLTRSFFQGKTAQTASVKGSEVATVLARDINQVHWAQDDEPKSATGKKGAKPVRVVAFADSRAMRTAIKVLREAKDPNVAYDLHSKGSRRMDFRATLNAGYRFPILTEALTHRFYAPGHVDVRNINEWCDSFGYPNTEAGLRRLYEIAASNEEGKVVPKALVSGLSNAEQNAISLSVYSKVQHLCKSFDAVELMLTHQEALVGLDPLLRERNVLQGTLTKLKYAKRVGGNVVLRVDGASSLKVGREINVIEDKSQKVHECRLNDMDFVTDSLLATLSTPRGEGENFLKNAEKHGVAVYAMTKPFIGGVRGESGDEWDERPTSTPVEGREIPLAIVLAGAPAE